MVEELQKIITSDGSISYYNPEFDETYHTRTGALEEALKKHVEPSQVVQKAADGDVVIADVCFGLGYNTIVALAKIREAHPDAFIQVFAFENDKRILQKIEGLKLPEEYSDAHKIVSALVSEESLLEKKDDYELYVYDNNNVVISLYVGDVQKTIHLIAHEVADVIFFDPFSPTKHPALWSKQFLVNVSALLVRGGILTTYSCAKTARESLAFAGLQVEDGPIVGRTSPGSLGIKPKLSSEYKETSSEE